MRIAVLQMAAADGDVGANFDQVANAARAASAAHAKLMVAPELSLSGYGAATGGRVAQVAQGRDSPMLARLKSLSGELGIAMVLGFPERDETAFFNCAVAITPDREPVFYRKCHLYGELERKSFGSGSTVSPIITVEDFRIGMLICYDVEFPEWARVLALEGVDLIAVPTALPLSDANRRVARSMIRTRALENGVFVAYADLCGEDGLHRYQGSSAIVGPDGEDLARGGAAPCLLIADLDRSRYPSDAVDPYLKDRRCDIYERLVRQATR